MNGEDIKTVKLIINSEQATKKLDEINSKLDIARTKKQEALEKGDAKGLQVYSKEVNRLEREQRKLQTRAETVAKVLKNLDKATPNELRRTIQEINKELNSGAVERGSKEWDTLTASLRQANEQLKKIKAETQAASDVASWSDKLSAFGAKWVGIITSISQGLELVSGVKQTMSASIEAYASMQEAESDVRKYTGLTTEEVAELNEEFKKMDTRTGREQLNALAADAGRLGIQGKEGVMEFVEAADMINIALGEDLGDDAIKNIGKLAQLFGDADRMGLKGAMMATASTINDLGQTSSASESYIVEFTGRLAGAGAQANMTQAEIMALGAVLDQSMVNAEEGSTALSKIIQKIYREPQKVAQAAGLDVSKFTKLVQEDANEALLQFATAVSQMGGMEKIAPMLGDMQLTGAGVSKTLMALAGNIDLVKNTQDQATRSFAVATSAEQEYNVANNTVQANLDKAKSKFNDLRVELGEKLLPVQKMLAGQASAFIKILIQLIEFTTQHWKAIAVITASLVMYTAAIKANILWAGLCSAATKVQIAALYAWDYAVKAARISALGFRTVIGLLHVGFIALTQGTKAATVAMRALNIALKANPYALAASVIASLGLAIFAWTTRTKEQTEAQKQQNRELERAKRIQKSIQDIDEQVNRDTAEKITLVKQLSRVIIDNTQSEDSRRAAINKLKEIIPSYNGMLGDEKKLTEQTTAAVSSYITELRKAAKARVIFDKLSSIEESELNNTLSLQRRQGGVYNMRKKLNAFLSELGDKADAVVNGNLGQYRQFSGIDMAKSSRIDININNGQFTRARAEYKRLKASLEEAEGWVAETQENLDTIAAQRKQIEGLADKVNVTDVVNNGGTGNGSGNGTGNGDPVKTAMENLRARAEKERITAKLEYEKGLIDRDEFETKMYEADLRFNENAAKLYKKGAAERSQYELAQLEGTRKNMRIWSLRESDILEQEETAAAKQRYVSGTLSEKEYQEELTRIKLDALKRRMEYEKSFGTQEQAYAAEKAYNDAVLNDKLQRRERYMQQVDALRKKYLDKGKTEELDILKELYDQKILSEEEYQELKKKIQEKQAEDEKKEKQKTDPLKMQGSIDPVTSAFINLINLFDQLEARKKAGEATWQDYAAVATGAIGLVSAAMSAASQLVQANMQLEQAKINERYDAEIKAAGDNPQKVKELEEARDKELQKMRQEQLKKFVAIQIAQAVAQGSMAAINAYSSAAAIPVIGWKIAPVAAALALAATGIQIATIKKQAEAQAAGYYEGGFTGGANYHREAGVVHEGEFVANHKAVNNPNVAPVLRLIDHAQRTNTIASLSADDVSRSVAASQMVARAAAAPSPVVITESSTTRDTLRRLTETLEAGIESYVILDGERGLDKQWNHYQNLKNRK